MTNPPLVRLARIIISLELPILITIAPALLFPTPARLVVLAAVPILWMSAHLAGEPIIPPTPMNVALWLMLFMVGVSLVVTIDVRLSLGKISGMILGTLLFWAIVRWLTTPDRLRIGLAAYLLSGAGLAVIGLLGTNWDNKFPAIGAITAQLPMAIRGVPGAERGFSTNAVAGCLVLFIPLQVALLATGGRWASRDASRGTPFRLVVAESCLLMLTAGTLILTESRTAWIGMLVAGVAFMLWHRRWTQVVVVVSGIALAILTLTIGPDQISQFVVERSGPAFVSTFSLRTQLWTIGLTAIRDFPFTGMGMNVFRKLMPVQYPGYPALPGEEVAHVHNHLLQAAIDLGLPGLVAYVAIWLTAAGLLVVVYRQARTSAYRAMAAGLGAGLIAHFVFGLADVIPLGAKVGVLFWMTLALVVALHRVAIARSA